MPSKRLSAALAALTTLLLVTAQARGQGASDDGGAIVADSALLRVVEQVTVPARTAGVLSLLSVEEGDLVTRGQALAAVDDVEVRLMLKKAEIECELAAARAASDAAVRSARKSLEFATGEFQRLDFAATELPGSISRSELEESRNTVVQAELNLEQAELDRSVAVVTHRLKQAERDVAGHSLQTHEVLSPLDGMVVEVMRRRGEWVEPGEDVLRIMRIDRLRAEGLFDLHELPPDPVGAPAEITVEIGAGARIVAMGTIVFVSPEINPVNGRVRVRAEFDNEAGGRLKPGMRAKMVIPTTRGAPAPADAGRNPDPTTRPR